MDKRLADALRRRCPACDEALVDQTHPTTYRRSDGPSAHTYEVDSPDLYFDFPAGLGRLLPIDWRSRSPLDVRDIAALLGVRADTVHKWRHRGVIPAEDGRVSDQPWWWPDTIDLWATETRRWPGYVRSSVIGDTKVRLHCGG